MPPAWSTSLNHVDRLTGVAKHHLPDPPLAAPLVGLTRTSLLSGAGGTFAPNDGTNLGQLFEALATLSVRVFAAANAAGVSHLRQSAGRHEVDLIGERNGDRAAFTTGTSAHRRRDGIAVIPLGPLGP